LPQRLRFGEFLADNIVRFINLLTYLLTYLIVLLQLLCAMHEVSGSLHLCKMYCRSLRYSACGCVYIVCRAVKIKIYFTERLHGCLHVDVFRARIVHRTQNDRCTAFGVSQGSVATRLRCGRTFNDSIVANFLQSVSVKDF